MSTNPPARSQDTFKKGETAFRLLSGHVNESALSNFGLQEVVIQSWGKKNGTCTNKGEFIHQRVHTENHRIFRTPEAAKEYVGTVGLRQAVEDFHNYLHCYARHPERVDKLLPLRPTVRLSFNKEVILEVSAPPLSERPVNRYCFQFPKAPTP